jgi:hypothetical protein
MGRPERGRSLAFGSSFPVTLYVYVCNGRSSSGEVIAFSAVFGVYREFVNGVS